MVSQKDQVHCQKTLLRYEAWKEVLMFGSEDILMPLSATLNTLAEEEKSHCTMVLACHLLKSLF